MIKEWIKEELAEEFNLAMTKAHYLLYISVIKKNSTTRVRPVFDVSKDKIFEFTQWLITKRTQHRRTRPSHFEQISIK